MKLIGAAFGIAALCAMGAAAQTQTTHESGTQKIEVQDGKKITIDGCLEPNPSGGYLLTSEAGDMKYALITDRNLDKQVNKWVQVRGKATDRGDAKVKVETKRDSSVGTTGSTEELKGNLDLKYLGVDSVKVLSKHCR